MSGIIEFFIGLTLTFIALYPLFKEEVKELKKIAKRRKKEAYL